MTQFFTFCRARNKFFLAGATFLLSLALHRMLYIIVTHLDLQGQIKEVNGKDVLSQPKDLSSRTFYCNNLFPLLTLPFAFVRVALQTT